METLLEKSEMKINTVKSGFDRYLLNKIDFNERLICIKGARGCGKTTMLLQYAKNNIIKNGKTLYASLDDIYFFKNNLGFWV